MLERSGVVIIENDRVALIRRVRDGATYHLFPGGGVEEGETRGDAARREAREELGLDVVVGRLVMTVAFGQSTQYYYAATTVGGEFGTGDGAELSLPATFHTGSYEPVWLRLADLIDLDVRPAALAAMIADGAIPDEPVTIVEPVPSPTARPGGAGTQVAALDPGALVVGAARLTMPEYAPDARTARATLATALDLGVALIDTASCYGPHGAAGDGVNERFVRDVVRSHRRPDALVATKAGRLRASDGSWITDGQPEYLRSSVERSLRALDVDRIDLLHLHKPDPAVPLEESYGTLVDLVAEGKVHRLGLSNCTAAEARLAAAIHPLATVQNSLSPRMHPQFDTNLVLGEHVLLGWAPLAGVRPDEPASDAGFTDVAAQLGVSPIQVALAWLRSFGVTPIVGPRSPAEVRECASADALVLDDQMLGLLPT